MLHIIKHQKKEALQQLLTNYRDTPHPATGLAPSSMLFRDSPRSTFPKFRTAASDKDIEVARFRDATLKAAREKKVNSSKYKSPSHFIIGDLVLIRNFNKRSKYDPYFQPEPCYVKSILQNYLLLERNGTEYRRHPDDVKLFPGSNDYTVLSPISEKEQLEQWHAILD